MPLNLDDNSPLKFPNPEYLTLDNFKRGVITLIDKSRLPKNALEEADNIFLVEDGQPTVRPGVDWYGNEVPNASAIQGADYFDFDGVIHLVVVAGGTVYRSLDDGNIWTACTGATLDASAAVNLNQYNAFLYITNGINPIVRYDGTTTLQTYANLATPATPSVAKTGLAGTGYSYYYKVSAVNAVGFTEACLSPTTVLQTNVNRADWSVTNYATLTIGAVAGATRYDVYLSEDASDYYYIGSTATTTYQDDGSGLVNPAITAPTEDTSEGPLVAELTNVGSRMYGVRDTNNRYRIWFSGAGGNAGAFSTAYDGGYLDWSEGGKYIPVKVEDYRDGKGTPYATVWCKSADGQGCIIQMSLDVVTVQDISITVPSAYKLPGSRGTPAPGSVVNVLNDYMFYNSQAFYNLGSRAQFLNLLSTDEASANIRPTIKAITSQAEENICSVYYDAKVYFSVPYGSTTNNHVAIFDTERKAWLPKAFTIGFARMFRYTDTSGNHHLLAYKPGDTKLSQIDASIQGDYREPFTTSLVTGLYPVTKNRFEFQWLEEGEVEFSNPQGQVNIELLGFERSRGFATTRNQTIDSSLTTTGWDSFAWDTTAWDDTSAALEAFSESSVKRYFNVQKELNAIQWRITTNTLSGNYVLRTLQTWGTPTLAGKPRSWKL